MSISVYRIFVSAGWSGADDLARLTAALDRMRALLYRFDQIGERDLQLALGDKPALETALRIAMTQSHVAVARIVPNSPPSLVELTERHIARTGFRRQIPVIGIIEGGSSEAIDPIAHQVDRVVSLDPEVLAITIQELTEQASADRRRANETLLSKPLDIVATEIKTGSGAPELPYEQIIEAFEELQTSRTPIRSHLH